jgi:hypothetical protein
MNPKEPLEEKSKIEELKKSLYSRSAPEIRTHRHAAFHGNSFGDVKTDWEHPKEEFDSEGFNEDYVSHSGSFFTKILIGSIIFFFIALGIGAYLVFKGAYIVSANNIDINLAGPISVSGGEPVAFNVQVTNKNGIPLQVVNVDVEFPSGTTDPTDTTQELKSFQKVIPDIKPGSVGEQAVSAVLYGQENTKKTIAVIVNYRVAGSSATFTKEKDFDILINSSPLTLSINSFKEVNSNQELDFDVTVTSNSKQIVKNLLLNAAYPFGYAFAGSTPKPVNSANSVWTLGDLPPGGKRTVHIQGKVQGQDGDTRVFKFGVGVPDASNPKALGTEYIASSQTVTINKPFLALALTLNGDNKSTTYVGSFDLPMRGQITWFNNLPTSIINGEVHLDLSGTAYDKASIRPDSGFYDSINNEIIWNKVTTPELGTIGAGDSGTVTFSVTPRDLSTPGTPMINPIISLAVSGKANRISETDVPQTVSASITKDVKISSNVALAGQIVRSVGPFTNTGPIPPRAEQQTTYSVAWTVSNTSSTIDGLTVKTTLPPYVKWMNAVSPGSENVTYDSVSGQVTWNVGNLSAYVGGESNKRTAVFQIGFTPGIDLVGNSQDLTGQTKLSARDDFTGQQLTNTIQPMNTNFSSDPAFASGNEIVQK